MDELVKDKIKAMNLLKAKEEEEKDVVAQQVHIYAKSLCCFAYHSSMREKEGVGVVGFVLVEQF